MIAYSNSDYFYYTAPKSKCNAFGNVEGEKIKCLLKT